MDGVGGNCESIKRQSTISKGKDRIIVLKAKEFADVVSRFVPSKKIAYIDQSTIDVKINS